MSGLSVVASSVSAVGMPDGDAEPEVLRALAVIREVASGLVGRPTWSLSDAQMRSSVAEADAAVAAMQAARLSLIRDLDARPDAVAGARPDKTAATFLVHACRVSPGQAYRDVAAAHAIDPDGGQLPQLGAALAAGEVSRAHVEVAVRAMNRIPAHLTRAVDEAGVCGAERVDGFLTEHSKVLAPCATDKLAQQLLATLDPDGADRFDPAAYERRGLWCAVDGTGMLVGRFQLDPAGAATVKAALDVYAAPKPQTLSEGQDGQQVLLGEDRNRSQRYADALTEIARRALTGAPSSAGEPAQVLVVATPDHVADATTSATKVEAAGWADCAQTGPIGPGTLGRLSCDAILSRVLLAPDGGVLNLGRGVRTASPAQRKALAARDRGCVIPGCTATPGMCEAHHVTWYRNGGRTDITNLALLCGHHHTAVHSGLWEITMRDGLPWVRPPTWIDPHRRPLRNIAHHATDQAKRLGHQLRLQLDHTPDQDSGPPGDA